MSTETKISEVIIKRPMISFVSAEKYMNPPKHKAKVKIIMTEIITTSGFRRKTKPSLIRLFVYENSKNEKITLVTTNNMIIAKSHVKIDFFFFCVPCIVSLLS